MSRTGRPSAFTGRRRSRRRNAGLAAAGLAVSTAAVVLTERRWRSAEDPCAATVLDTRGARAFKVERPDGAVLDGVVVGPDDGPTVVLAHCWTGSRAVWEPVAARLVAAGRRVVLYDQRGHGASTLGSDDPTVDALGEDLAAVLETVDARDAVVAGHSMGGMTVAALAVGHPDVVAERVRAFVLVGTAAFDVAAGFVAGPFTFLTASRGVERLLAGRFGPALTRGTVGKGPRLAHLVATRDAFLSLDADVRRRFLTAMQAMDLRRQLAGVTVPTTVVVGRRDLLTPPRLARALAAAIPGARCVEIPGAGHMLPYEVPDRLAELILAAGPQEGGAS